LLFPAAIRAGGDTGSQGRQPSMTGSGTGNITIGHVWGIPIQINPSLFLILALLTWTLAGGLLPAAYPELGDVGRWLTALLTALLFFASILFHELAHAWVARRSGIPVVSITLYIFGGIAQIGGKPNTAGEEFRIAAVGPLSTQIIAYGLIGLGAFRVFQGDVVGGIWSVFIGFILHNAATTEKRAFLQQGQLAGIPVSQVMGIVREPEVPAGLTIQDLVERHILGQGQGSFIVIAAGNPVGVLSLRDVSNVPRADWDKTTIGDVMTPLTDLPRVAPNDELLTAVQLMDANELLQLPVFDGSQLAGLLTRDEVIRYLRLRSETGLSSSKASTSRSGITASSAT